MNSQQFSELIGKPALVARTGRNDLEDLVTRYPYCQTGHLLLSLYLFANDDPGYPASLKKAAAYAGDRGLLKNLISDITVADQPVIARVEKEVVTIHQPAEFPESEPQPATRDRLTREELLAIVRKRLAELDTEKRPAEDSVTREEPEEREPIQPVHEAPHKPKPSKSELIDKFIREEPSISRPKAAFFSPSDSAVRSNFDDGEIVSETLAQLFASQGNIQKAVQIYEKLSLVNQEKSRYFAAQIDKLRSS